MYVNNRLQLRCATLDVNTLSERELCVAVLFLNSSSLLMSFAGNQTTERDDLMASVVLLNGQTLTDAGRDLLRQITSDHLERLRQQQANDLRSDERRRREPIITKPVARPDLGVTLASIGDMPATHE